MSIAHISERILENVPALGRDFQEGALYDARNEKIVIGYSLWNANDLRQIEARRNDDTHFTMNASDTLREELSGLECDASVQLSILSGLIEMKGSLKYLKENKSTRRQSSVQVRCLYKTAIKEMGMEQLTNIRYPDVAKTGHNDTATHFVIKIQYGAGAIFNLTWEFQSEEQEKTAKTEIKIIGENMLGIIKGKAEGNVNAYNRNFTRNQQIKCEFHSFGLSLTEACPTTYEGAIKFAGNLARMASQSMAKDRNGEALGVPCIVWLHPLVTLQGCADAPILYYEIDLNDLARWTALLNRIDTIITFLDEIADFKECSDSKSHIDRWNQILDINITVKAIIKCRGVARYQVEKMTEIRSDSLIKLRKLIVDIRSGRKKKHRFRKLENDIHEKMIEFREWIRYKSDNCNYY